MVYVQNLQISLTALSTGCFKKKLTIGFPTSTLNLTVYSHTINISNAYILKYIQLATILAFIAHWEINIQEMATILEFFPNIKNYDNIILCDYQSHF